MSNELYQVIFITSNNYINGDTEETNWEKED